MDRRDKLNLLTHQCVRQRFSEQSTPPPYTTVTSHAIVNQLIENSMNTIDVDVVTPGGTPGIAQVAVTANRSNVSNNQRKTPFPGDFIENRNRKSCVRKIQTDIFAETTDVLDNINRRNDWFERKLEHEWFMPHGIFQEQVYKS